MKYFHLFLLTFLSFNFLKSEVTLKAKSPEERDLNCITLLTLASEDSKKSGEMIKYEKLKKLKKNYLSKYPESHFSDGIIQTSIDKHNLKIKDKGKRYINKGLQKCGLK